MRTAGVLALCVGAVFSGLLAVPALSQTGGEETGPYIMITADQHLWAADGVTDKFLQYDLNGKLLSSWGTHGIFPGAVWGVHQFSVDSDGNLYAAEAWGGRTQKFRPKPGAHASKLIGAPIPLMPKASD